MVGLARRGLVAGVQLAHVRTGDVVDAAGAELGQDVQIGETPVLGAGAVFQLRPVLLEERLDDGLERGLVAQPAPLDRRVDAVGEPVEDAVRGLAGLVRRPGLSVRADGEEAHAAVDLLLQEVADLVFLPAGAEAPELDVAKDLSGQEALDRELGDAASDDARHGSCLPKLVLRERWPACVFSDSRV